MASRRPQTVREPPSRGPISRFVRERRRSLGYTQRELAERTGTGLRFIRELEGGKSSVRVDKVNQVLAFFGNELAPAPMKAGAPLAEPAP